jgi:hypothetical protein
VTIGLFREGDLYWLVGLVALQNATGRKSVVLGRWAAERQSFTAMDWEVNDEMSTQCGAWSRVHFLGNNDIR